MTINEKLDRIYWLNRSADVLEDTDRAAAATCRQIAARRMHELRIECGVYDEAKP